MASTAFVPPPLMDWSGGTLVRKDLVDDEHLLPGHHISEMSGVAYVYTHFIQTFRCNAILAQHGAPPSLFTTPVPPTTTTTAQTWTPFQAEPRDTSVGSVAWQLNNVPNDRFTDWRSKVKVDLIVLYPQWALAFYTMHNERRVCDVCDGFMQKQNEVCPSRYDTVEDGSYLASEGHAHTGGAEKKYQNTLELADAAMNDGKQPSNIQTAWHDTCHKERGKPNVYHREGRAIDVKKMKEWKRRRLRAVREASVKKYGENCLIRRYLEQRADDAHARLNAVVEKGAIPPNQAARSDAEEAPAEEATADPPNADVAASLTEVGNG